MIIKNKKGVQDLPTVIILAIVVFAIIITAIFVWYKISKEGLVETVSSLKRSFGV